MDIQHEEIEGSVDSIVFLAPESGFTVARFETLTESLITIVGSFATLTIGQSFKLFGTWRNHPRYGEQFQVVRYVDSLPRTTSAIEKYLGSGMIRGIGPATAKRIVDRFGLNTLMVIETDIEKLTEIKGIAKTKLAWIQSAWIEQRHIHTIMIFLQSHGISKTHAVRIYKHYGPDAIEVVSKNPYQLAAEIRGIGFHSADGVATSVGISPDSPFRYRSAIAHVLREAGREGHCFLPEPQLIQRTVRLLTLPNHQPDAEQVKQEIYWLADQGELFTEESRIRPGLLGYYLPAFYRAETGLAEYLSALLAQNLKTDPAAIEAWIATYCNQTALPLSDEQRQAVFLAATQRVLILTGGPGVGKTHTTRAIVELWRSQGKSIALASPTGRAAQRLAELTGREASTIHRLLEYDAVSGQFQRDATRPIEADAIVVDEFSMTDVFLAHSLIKAISPKAQLLIVGDADQLPSVGPGAVLRDLIRSQKVAIVRLTRIFRQAETSAIVRNAHAINRGEFPVLESLSDQPQSDCLWMNAPTPNKGIAAIRQLVTDRIPTWGLDPFADVQILCPMIKTETGTRNLNQILQALLNPPHAHKAEFQSEALTLRSGDRVIQLENDYDRMVFNGELGTIEAFDPEHQQLQVQFSDQFVSYDRPDFDELALAYSITGHKAQGSEFPVVVVPLFMQNAIMLTRPWLYTAMTRAKKFVILVGQRQAIDLAVQTCRDQRRYTFLMQRLSH